MFWLLIHNLDMNEMFVDPVHIGSPFASTDAAMAHVNTCKWHRPRTHYRITGDDHQLVAEGLVFPKGATGE